MTDSPKSFDPKALRSAFGCFMTGVTVVATRDTDGTPRGFTANSFNTVSLEPALISICIDRRAASYEVFAQASYFAISILAEGQREVANLFASKSASKFQVTPWHTQRSGAPIIDHCTAWFDCRSYRQIEAGDHLLLLGEVIAYAHSAANPLGYCKGNYVIQGTTTDALLHASGQKLDVGFILERDARLLLMHDPEQGWYLPMIGCDNVDASDPNSIPQLLRQLQLRANYTFLFSVFEQPSQKQMAIYYRGELGDVSLRSQQHLVRYNEIPWEELRSDTDRAMLERYIKERANARFGVYVGTAGHSVVAAH